MHPRYRATSPSRIVEAARAEGGFVRVRRCYGRPQMVAQPRFHPGHARSLTCGPHRGLSVFAGQGARRPATTNIIAGFPADSRSSAWLRWVRVRK